MRLFERVRLSLASVAICWVLLVLIAGAPFAQANAADTFALSEVAAGVFVHEGKPLALDAPGHDDIANIGFIVGTKCVAVIDTGGSVRIGRALRDAIHRRTTVPICHVINTHAHVDHVLGNSAFRKGDTQFIGHATLAEALGRNRDLFVRDYAADLDPPASGAQIVGPDRVVERELQLDLGGRTITLQAWPKSHTDCDLSVFDSLTGTLWTGDLLFRKRLPALDGSIVGWLSVIDQLGRMNVAHVVPGHGPVTNDLAAGLVSERDYLQALADGVRDTLRRGGPVEDAIRDSAREQRSHWLLWDETHPRNVVRAYQELEWE
jgi:quinoprotein relay system zinc metallohydrolase 2